MSAEPPFRFSLIFEAGSGICLWAADEATRRAFGHAPDLDRLPLDTSLRDRLFDLTRRCEAVIIEGVVTPEGLCGHTLFGYEPEAIAFAPEIVELTAMLRQALGSRFLIEHQFGTPSDFRLAISWDRSWLLKAGLGSLFLAPLAGWFAHAIALEGLGEDLSPAGRGLLAAMFLVFAVLFAGTAMTYIAALVRRGPVITLGPAGLLDRRLSAQPIPWTAIAAVTPLQRGAQMMLVLHLAESKSLSLPANPVWALNRLGARLTGNAEFAVKVTGLDVTLPALLDAIAHQAR